MKKQKGKQKIILFYLKFERMIPNNVSHVTWELGDALKTLNYNFMVRKMTDTWRLDVLPSDVLLLIFDYCNEYDLLRLSEVCKRFYEIIRSDVAWVEKSKRYLATNQATKRFRERCLTILRPRATWRVSYNWHYGIYKKKTIFTRKTRLMPWLKLSNNILWWCGGNQLVGFNRSDERQLDELLIEDIYEKDDFYYIEQYTGGDICKFVLWKNFIICGYTNGTILYFLRKFSEKVEKNKYFIVNGLLNNRSCVNAIDATSENVIAGLECGTIKIQRHPDMDRPVYDEEICIRLMDKVQSLSVNPTATKFAVGSSGISDVSPLHVIDIERYTTVDTMRHAWKHGAGILDMVWDDPNTLLTCGYDTYIRKWDLRTGKCVCSWADPTDATLYCISSDHQYTMVTGTQYNCLAVLWDQRKSDFVQLYYMTSSSRSSSRCSRSPIYSVQFDNVHLYCATDRHVRELNFSETRSKNQKFDYKSLYPSCGLLGSCR
ncbi:PREDICTED: F-box/WD repeat-containing protein 4-like [Wasmannia auropunctata]|uniref:F-box/WD repeat-containing protein 4-like n=1 Tax=Wasmannia auropunctata TaxID=64793 RepID=UPI0005EF12DF|nr:PREDICTED: F-box/WD repeat-containing protein 4-like [Wasmannia auropunctata]